MRIERAIVVAYQYIEELEELDTAECSLHKDKRAEHRCITVCTISCKPHSLTRFGSAQGSSLSPA